MTKNLSNDVFNDLDSKFISATIDYDGCARVHKANVKDLNRNHSIWQPFETESSLIIGYDFDCSAWEKSAISRKDD